MNPIYSILFSFIPKNQITSTSKNPNSWNGVIREEFKFMMIYDEMRRLLNLEEFKSMN